VSSAPHFDIDVSAFWQDPYPSLARMRKEAPIAFVPQLGSTLLCCRDDIFVSEKQIDVFSSHQPEGLMNRLMGHNMMRKDGDAHMDERKAIFPAVSPKTVRSHWTAQFEGHAQRILDALQPDGAVDFVQAFALPFSAECLKSITGLTNIGFEDMDAWSQGMIEGIANYSGDPAVDISQKSNSWAARNYTRWVNADYNKLYDQVKGETDVQKATQLWMQMNDIVINAFISVPLIDRKSTDAKVKALQGPTLSPFDDWPWNIADWTMTP